MHTVAELWPVLADTNRFNEAMGLPPYALEETPQPNGTVLRRGKGKAAGFTLEWEEKPYEWIHGRHFRQAREFTNVAGVNGIVLTKLDGTAKGGVAVAIAHELKLPIRFVGVGETIDDLVPFSAEEYVDGLFEEKW